MVSNGHQVYCLLEEKIQGDPYYKKQNYFKRKYLIYKFEKNHCAERYWEEKLKSPLFNQSFDLLFVIQGCTFHPILLEHLRIYNPNIHSSLYIWDSNVMYDFFRNVDYFDLVYSFDFMDIKKYGKGKVKFLPFFWSNKLESLSSLPSKYSISSIGTNHDGRFHIYKQVIDQLKNLALPHYIRLIIPSLTNHLRTKERIIYWMAKLLNNVNIVESYDIKLGNITYEWIENIYYSSDSLYQIMAESQAILDTDNSRQHGTTPRLIWALALNKHVYTTNRHIENLPFYDSQYIHIIDRKNPKIDISFISQEISYQIREKVNYLRIDNWVRNFIDF